MLELIEHMVAANLIEKARPFQNDPRTMMQFDDRKRDAATRQVDGNLAERDRTGTIQEITSTGVQDEVSRSHGTRLTIQRIRLRR